MHKSGKIKYLLHYILYIGILCVTLMNTVSCSQNKKTKDQNTIIQNETETAPALSTAESDSTAKYDTASTAPESPYPFANDRMVYALSEEGVLTQWSLDGTIEKTFSMTSDRTVDLDSVYFELLWVGNSELIWSLNDDDNTQEIYTTPINKTKTGEDVKESETKKLFTLPDTWESIESGTDNLFEEPNLIYVTDEYILYEDYFHTLYLYDREKDEKPKKIKSTSYASISPHANSLSAEVIGDRIMIHMGRKAGTIASDNNKFYDYNFKKQKAHTIDGRCFSGAAFIADPIRNTAYYQISDDQSIWQYDCETRENKELISETQFKTCFKDNGLLWDDAYYDDALFLGENCIYFIKNITNPLVFSYSLTDHSLSYQKELTMAIQNSGYNDSKKFVEQRLRIVEDKLLLFWENTDSDEYYICIDIPTAEMKAVKENDTESIYFRMLGMPFESDIPDDWKTAQTTDTRDDPATGKQTDAQTLGVDDQLACISNNSKEWAESYDNWKEMYYAVTDLDQNGKLEIIATLDRQGSGSFTTNNFYQVSADGTSLRRIIDAMGHDPDIAGSTETVYYDKKEDTYYYLAYDYASAGMGARYTWFGAFALKNGILTHRTYADGETTYNKKKKEEVWHYTTYKNDKATKIKNNEFNRELAADNFFADLKKKKVNISWFHLKGKERKSRETISEKVRKSYEGFKID